MKSSEVRNSFWFGTHYYSPPTPTQAEWEDDMKRLKEYGLRKIQYRVYWKWHERREDKFHWQDLDQMFELCDKNRVKLILQVMLESAPQYIYDKYNGYRVDIRGQRIWPISHAAFYPGGWSPCFDNPDVMRHALKFTDILVDRYKNYTALEFWSAWNEPRCRPMGECACEYSIANYRKWLKEHFGTIDSLNEKFGKCWPDFESIDIWSSLSPALSSGASPSNTDVG